MSVVAHQISIRLFTPQGAMSSPRRYFFCSGTCFARARDAVYRELGQSVLMVQRPNKTFYGWDPLTMCAECDRQMRHGSSDAEAVDRAY